MKSSLLALLFTLLGGLSYAQELPTVINVKSNTSILEELSAKYRSSLFSASDKDINETSKNWKHLLSAMELYGKQISFEIKGVRIWIKVFWAKSGKIDFITYYLLDKSKNVDKAELEAFLKSFTNNYELPVSHNSRFSYAGRVQFPVYMMR